MKQSEISTSRGTFILVAVPKGAGDFKIYKALRRTLPDTKITRLVYRNNKRLKDRDLYVGHDECELIGLASELTEEQIKQVIESWDNHGKIGFSDYSSRPRPMRSRLQSLIASSGLMVADGEDVLIIKKL